MCVWFYLFTAVLGLRRCAGSGPVMVSGAAPHCRAQVPTAVASLVAKHGLQGVRAPEHRLSYCHTRP